MVCITIRRGTIQDLGKEILTLYLVCCIVLPLKASLKNYSNVKG